MPVYQFPDPVYGVIVIAEPFQYLFCHFAAPCAMSAEMINPVFIRGSAVRLTKVVEKHDKAQYPVRPDSLHGQQRMLPYIPAVVGISLRGLHKPVELRQDDPGNTGFPCKDQILGMRTDHKLCQLGPDTLRAHLFQISGMAPYGRLCLFFYRKTKLGGKTHSPHNPQGILGKSFIGIPHAAHNSFFQVLFSGKSIHQPAFFIIGHSVNGEVPSLQIFNEVCGKNHLFWMPSVLIFPIHPVSGDLITLFMQHDRHRTMLDSRINGAAEQRLRLLRPGRGGDIPVVRGP